ncbi:hypothetical protein EDD99_0926 [Streptomyces sp. 846.5]|nr:hypothetical protein [Streptomyces sp. 846.5]TDU02528.1 hypothetical protein EDD99_0926 [Streptomyces sp. 846.5]
MRTIPAVTGLLILAGVSGCSSAQQGRPASTAVGSTGSASRTAPHALDRPGDPHCAIAYHSAGADMTTWTATTTVRGELVSQASHPGKPDRNDDVIPAGKHTYIAWAALAKLTDLSGVLHVDGALYPCSVAPAP